MEYKSKYRTFNMLLILFIYTLGTEFNITYETQRRSVNYVQITFG